MSLDRSPRLQISWPTMLIEAERLQLRPWRDADRDAFAAMHADPEVMWDLGGPISYAESEAKLDRYVRGFEQSGVSRWALIRRVDGVFIGYAGALFHPDHPLGPHFDMGWRLVRSAWGFGYATEASGAALKDLFTRLPVSEALAYTSPDNLRSQAVMARLGLRREPSRDFTALYPGLGEWRGLVWAAAPDQFREIEISTLGSPAQSKTSIPPDS